ncbi:hypothetical protein FHU30_001677 [Actinomadura rupiterrae]|nr:hypothetical protein [Actinomadura rupiterrae]
MRVARRACTSSINASRPAERDPRLGDLLLGAGDPLRHRLDRHQEGARDLRRAEAAEEAQGERHPVLGGQRRMGAGEEQPEPLVRKVGLA